MAWTFKGQEDDKVKAVLKYARARGSKDRRPLRPSSAKPRPTTAHTLISRTVTIPRPTHLNGHRPSPATTTDQENAHDGTNNESTKRSVTRVPGVMPSFQSLTDIVSKVDGNRRETKQSHKVEELIFGDSSRTPRLKQRPKTARETRETREAQSTRDSMIIEQMNRIGRQDTVSFIQSKQSNMAYEVLSSRNRTNEKDKARLQKEVDILRRANVHDEREAIIIEKLTVENSHLTALVAELTDKAQTLHHQKQNSLLRISAGDVILENSQSDRNRLQKAKARFEDEVNTLKEREADQKVKLESLTVEKGKASEKNSEPKRIP